MQNQKGPRFVAVGLLAVALPLIVSAFTVSSSEVAGGPGQHKGIVEKIKTLPTININIDNSEESPILVQSATAREITDQEYEQLTGERSSSIRYTSCPTIKIINNTNRKVMAYSVGLMDSARGDLYVFRSTRRKIQPFEEFFVEPVDWAEPRNEGARKFTQEQGITREDKSLPGWDSKAMWFPGNATDFSIFVGEVKFADGTRWVTKRR